MGRQDADMLREKDVAGDNWPSWGVGFGRRPFRSQPLSRAAANKIRATAMSTNSAKACMCLTESIKREQSGDRSNHRSQC